MRPEEVRSRGTALMERVRTQVDTSERLEIMLRAHRRSRLVTAIATAAAVLAVVAGILLLARVDEAPVVTLPAPSTTVPDLESLPVEVFVVLRNDYTVDEATGVCEGSGPLAGIGEGSLVHILDESELVDGVEELPSITLPAGAEVGEEDAGSSFLLGPNDTAVCVFALPDLGYDVSEYENVILSPEPPPEGSLSHRVSGQRVVYTFGDPVFDLETELSADGITSDDPAIMGAETRAMRGSAGPGRIVGFVILGEETSSGPPDSPDQPVCVGAGAFADIRPGQPVVATDEAGQVVGESILRGSAYDGPIGCSLWFGIDVPPDLTGYLLSIADHPPLGVERAMLEEFGWQIDLWGDPSSMEANCVQPEEEAEPMTCLLLPPLP